MKDTEVKEFINKRGWVPLLELPANNTKKFKELNKKYGVFGVYQVAMKEDLKKIGNELVHKDICYTGSAKNIHARTATMRQENSLEHGVPRSIRLNKTNREDIMVRYYYVKDEPTAQRIEKNIQNNTLEKFDYKYKWTDASDGILGHKAIILDLLQRMPHDIMMMTGHEVKNVIKEKMDAEYGAIYGESIRT